MAEGQKELMSVADIHKQLELDTTGEFANKVLQGIVVPGNPVEPTPSPADIQQSPQPKIAQDTNPQVVVDDVPIESEEERLAREEQDKYERRIDTLRLEQDAAQKQHEQELAELKEQIKEQTRTRQEYETQLEEARKRLETIPAAQSAVPIVTEEDDPYASEYSKTNRQLISDLHKQLASLKSQDPRVDKIISKIDSIEQAEAAKLEADKRQREIDIAAQRDKKITDSVVQFQNKYKERFGTSKRFDSIRNDYACFRHDMATLINSNRPEEVDGAIYDYFNGKSTRANDLRNRAAKRGIEAPAECDKFLELASLVDLQNGIEFDPILKRYRPITDEFGNPVRYRSIDEAFKVSHFYDEINRARVSGAQEINNKLQEHRNSAVTLDNSHVSSSQETEAMTSNDAIKYMDMDSPQARRNPEIYAKIKRAYDMAKIPMPIMRGV